ncbi:MAG: hypothetical protein P4L73_03455 [Caulobacteraceae bacterium]|nr:hypothetical protein [Caulobacteraceae bacterium]
MAAQAFQRRHYPLMAGRPAISQPASAPAPRFELSLLERGALNRIRKTGHVGVAIGDDLLVTTAIRLSLLGHIRIDRGSPQRCFPIFRAVGS